MNVMEKFVKSVNIMDETILVPCRLMDMKVGDNQDQTATKHNPKNKNSVNTVLKSTDLFDMYNMLNSIKADLLWGGQGPNEEVNATSINTNGNSSNLNVGKGHVRRPSTVSVTSTNSSASCISDSESDSNEIDSGIEENTLQVEDGAQILAKNFKRHLLGLTNSLKQMTEAAQYLTTRYQHDIGGPI